MTTTQSKNTPDESLNVKGKLYNAFTYVASVAVGVRAASTSMVDAVFQKYKEEQDMFIHDARDGRRKFRQQEMEKQMKELGLSKYRGHKGQKVFPDMPLPDILQKVQEKFDRQDMKDLFKKNGFNSLHDYWRSLEPSRRNAAVERGFAFGAITLGVLLTIGNSKSVSKLFHSHKEQDAAPSR